MSIPPPARPEPPPPARPRPGADVPGQPAAPADPDPAVRLLHAVAVGDPPDDRLPLGPAHAFADADRAGPEHDAR
ncbi:hypothetical protein U5640_39275 [Streptomyces sp. SS7]|uniref:hypothetical protein n=1 Tax=Streptomyces sp. SS7 TaxID=3108485 RepID=UPI0030EF49A9